MNLSRNNEIRFGLLAISLCLVGCIAPSVRSRADASKAWRSGSLQDQTTAASIGRDIQTISLVAANRPIQPGSELTSSGIVQYASMPQFCFAADLPTVGNVYSQSIEGNSGVSASTTASDQAEEVQAESTSQAPNSKMSPRVDGQSLAAPIADADRNVIAPNWMELYVIETGDQLDIKFRTTSELNDLVTVRPDGMISMQIVGEIQAAGKSPARLRQDLIAAYSANLKNPDLAVIVRSFSGNSVYVGGEVFVPGRVALAGRITTIKAVILAGGFKDTADQRRVIVRRADGSCCTYDLESMLECKSLAQDIQLRPNDVVYVPKSRIAKVNLFVDQYINKVLPFSSSFGVFVTPTPGVSAGSTVP